MNCPHCSANLISEMGECPHCRFSVSTIRSLLGADWVRLERLTDNLNCLSLKEQRHMEIILDEFERNFPQCFFAVYLGALPAMITARDLGFWLINHGAFHTQQIAKRNDFGCALVIDQSRQVVAITLGYALEAHLADCEIKQILNEMNDSLARGRFGQSIEHAVAMVSKKLKRIGSRGLPDLVMNAMVPPDLGGLGFQTLRASHRPSRPNIKN